MGIGEFQCCGHGIQEPAVEVRSHEGYVHRSGMYRVEYMQAEVIICGRSACQAGVELVVTSI